METLCFEARELNDGENLQGGICDQEKGIFKIY